MTGPPPSIAACWPSAPRAAGFPVSIKIYPGANHSFDSTNPPRYVANRNNANKPGGKGATTGGDPAAWADAIKQVTAFFAAHLKGQQSSPRCHALRRPLRLRP